MAKIRVVVIDDVKDITDYFKILLNREKDIEVVGMASNVKEGIMIIEKMQPDIVLTDIEMESKEAGIDIIKKLKPHYPQIRFIVLTIHEEDDILYKSFESGADDYIIKTASASEILTSIRNVYMDRLVINPEITRKILNEFRRMKTEQNRIKKTLDMAMQLTKTEYEILKDLYYGETYKSISKKRMVEEVTIRTQGSSIIRKFKKKQIKEVIEDLKRIDFFSKY